MIAMLLRLTQCRLFGHARPIEEPTEIQQVAGRRYVVTASYRRCERCGRRVQ